MTTFAVFKLLHVTCAYVTGAGFLLRGVLSLSQSPLLSKRLLKVLPHLIDTLLLASAVGMLVIWSVGPFAMPWLTGKLIALLIYIGFGFSMLRWGTTPGRRWTGFLGGCIAYLYIVGAAHTKSALSLLSLI